MRRFEGKVVLITGASSGIGAELARQLAAAKALVAITARRVERLDALAGEIAASGGTALPLRCDVTSRTQIDDATGAIIARFGRLDIVVANAGYGVSGRFVDLSAEIFRKQFETNFFAVVDTIYAALPYLKQSEGQIAIVSSIAGRFGVPLSTAYSASKFAIIGLGESLYYELCEHNVAVTLLNPGSVRSDISKVDNEGHPHDDAGSPPEQLMVPTDVAVREMLHAIAERRPEATITGHGRALVWLNRHFPRSFRRLAALAVRGRLDKIYQLKRPPGSRTNPGNS